jgi:hypothetical protein
MSQIEREKEKKKKGILGGVIEVCVLGEFGALNIPRVCKKKYFHLITLILSLQSH